ncbi:MAG: hypothetical protein AAF958_09495 [Planctomycetota bacterium]
MSHPSPLPEAFLAVMSSGCDSRTVLDSTGHNRYGCGWHGRSLALGSCSSNPPSTPAIAAAYSAWEMHGRSGDGDAWIRDRNAVIRRRLSMRFGGPGSDVILTPSGTDVELLALWLADRDADRGLTNIIIGPDEIGSGSCLAASGRHFDSLSPRGDAITPAAPVDANWGTRVQCIAIPIRHDDGTPRQLIEINDQVTQTAIDAATRGDQIVLHVLLHSKTGIFAPDFEAIRRIQKHLADDVTVVIDAAQGRVRRTVLRRAVEAGDLVSLSGSKFFGGPAFCGALLLSSRRWLNRSLADRGVLNDAMRAYFHYHQWPEAIAAIAASDTASPANLGLTLRWIASLAEMDRFFAVPNRMRRGIAQAFHEGVRRLGSDHETIDANTWTVRPPEDLSFSGDTPTVLPLRLPITDRGELQELHKHLNFQHGYHLGQAVKIAGDQWALRVALGASLLSDVATCELWGATLDRRVQMLQDRLSQLGQLLAQWTSAVVSP